jgi:hypothetical protein
METAFSTMVIPCAEKPPSVAFEIWRIPRIDGMTLIAITKTEKSPTNRNLRDWDNFMPNFLHFKKYGKTPIFCKLGKKYCMKICNYWIVDTAARVEM